jgi:Flp pilus assembly protein TadG
MVRGWWRGLLDRRGLLDQSGGALIETAFFVSFFALPLMVGSAEIGRMTYYSIEVSNAAYAGAMYGMQSATLAADTNGITAAAQAEANDFGTGLTVTPTIFYACASDVTGTQYTGANAKSNATTACTRALEFIQVNTSVNAATTLKLVSLPLTFNLHGQAVIEVQQ